MGFARGTHQHCWCTQQISKMAKMPFSLFANFLPLTLVEEMFCGHPRKNLLPQLTEEGSSVDARETFLPRVSMEEELQKNHLPWNYAEELLPSESTEEGSSVG